MSDSPLDNTADDVSRAIENLLASDVQPEAFTRQLLAINIDQARRIDPELPGLLRACAIPRQFDEQVISVLRKTPEDHDGNKRLLQSLLGFSFVKEYSGGGYVYHDNVRDVLLQEWNESAKREQYDDITHRLVGLYKQRGKEARDQKRYEDALAALSAAIELAPDDDEAYFTRGSIHYQLGDYAAALADLTHAIELQANNSNDYYWRGRAYYELGDYAAALADPMRTVEMRPSKGAKYLWRGLTHYELSADAAALADLTRAIELQPNDGDNYYWRGLMHYQLGDHVAARADLTRAIELQPNNDDDYFWRDRMHYRLKSYRLAPDDEFHALIASRRNEQT